MPGGEQLRWSAGKDQLGVWGLEGGGCWGGGATAFGCVACGGSKSLMSGPWLSSSRSRGAPGPPRRPAPGSPCSPRPERPGRSQGPARLGVNRYVGKKREEASPLPASSPCAWKEEDGRMKRQPHQQDKASQERCSDSHPHLTCKTLVWPRVFLLGVLVT